MDIINISRPNQPPEEGDWVRVEYANGTKEEKEWHVIPEIPSTYLHISLPSKGKVGESFSIDISVRFTDGTLAPVNSTYSVPITRVEDGLVTSYHEVIFVDGEANLSVIPAFCGRLTLNPNLVEPLPTAKLPSAPIIKIFS